MQEKKANETIFGEEQVKIRQRKPRRAMKPVFKKTAEDTPVMFPDTLDSVIGEGDVVRYINTVINQIDKKELYESYQGGGRSAYDPEIMLKIIISCYAKKIYTSRKMAQACRENISIMWIGRKSTPNFRTIAGFRSGRLKEVIEKIFTQAIQLLIEEGYISTEVYFTDGTKILADANRYKVVWKKNAAKFKSNAENRVRELLREIEEEQKTEDKIYGDKDLEEVGEGKTIDKEKIRRRLEEMREKIQKQREECEEKPAQKKMNKRNERIIKTIVGKELPKIDKYEQQEAIAGNRSGYSKTDTDAAMHRWKDGRTLPTYNTMVSTSGQYVTMINAGQNASDSAMYKEHMKKHFVNMGYYPKASVGDSGFGSEENYQFLEENGIENYLKYSGFYNESRKKIRENPSRRENFRYDEEKDEYYCTQNRALVFREEEDFVTKLGHKTKKRTYQSKDCRNCPIAEKCKAGEGNRTITIRPELERYKQQAREKLNSDRGIELRKRRNTEPESFNGDIKHNMGFRRFHLRGLKKVETEITIVALAHNFRKMSLHDTQRAVAK